MNKNGLQITKMTYQETIKGTKYLASQLVPIIMFTTYMFVFPMVQNVQAKARQQKEAWRL